MYVCGGDNRGWEKVMTEEGREGEHLIEYETLLQKVNTAQPKGCDHCCRFHSRQRNGLDYLENARWYLNNHTTQHKIT